MKISSKIKAILLSMLCIAALTSCENEVGDVPAITSGETSAASAEAISGETSQTVSEREVAEEYPELEPLTEEADRKLREDYADFRIQNGGWTGLNADNVYVEYYYGTYDNGEVVVMFEYDGLITHSEKYFSVAGYEFYLCTTSFYIMLHHDSTFIPFEEAYQSGLLSDSDIAKIHYYS